MQENIIAMATDFTRVYRRCHRLFRLLLGFRCLKAKFSPASIATFLILALQQRDQKLLEMIIGGLLLFFAAAYIIKLIFSRPEMTSLVRGMAVCIPTLDTVLLDGWGMGYGATIMPHVIYLHSLLTQQGEVHTRAERYTAMKIDVAVVFHFSGNQDITDLERCLSHPRSAVRACSGNHFWLKSSG
ncbi:MAG: divalent metal cation transporter [Candidatus Malihini olakiniferum]